MFAVPLGSHRIAFRSALKSQHYSLLVGTCPSLDSIFNKVWCIVFQRLPDCFTDGNRNSVFLRPPNPVIYRHRYVFVQLLVMEQFLSMPPRLPFVVLCWVLAEEQVLGV